MNQNPNNYRPAQGTDNSRRVQNPAPGQHPGNGAYDPRRAGQVQERRPAYPNPQNPQAYPPRQGAQNSQGYPPRQNSQQQRPNPASQSYSPRSGQNPSYPRSATGAAYGSNPAYNPGNAGGRRQRDAMMNGRPATAAVQRREPAKRQKKPFRLNGGFVGFLLLAAVVLGISIWTIQRAGWNQKNPSLPDGEIVNVPEGSSPSSLDSAPEAGETGGSAESPDSAEPAETPANPDNSENAVPGGEGESAGTETPEPPAPETPAVLPPDEPAPDENDVNLTLYDTVTVGNASVSEGDLILVNANHAYSGGDAYAVGRDMKNAYSDRTGRLKVAATDINLKNEAFDALEKMVVDLEADTGSHDLLITSGHRTVAEQQEVWDYYLGSRGEEYTNAYVAKPGYSEHNTGLACDLSFYTDAGASVPVSEYEHGWWLAANCARDGFIRRYPDDKADITGISFEPWHFRYVGIPHAYICVRNNWCLEEYTEGVKAYSAEGKMLYVAEDGTVSEVSVTDGLPTSGGWLVYYAAKSPAGGQTDIKVPRGSDYEISGNNADGFVVTVDLR